MGFVSKEDMMNHGNHDVRANARMKYMVHTLVSFGLLPRAAFGNVRAEVQPLDGLVGVRRRQALYGHHVDNSAV
jgi:hypothetical protein